MQDLKKTTASKSTSNHIKSPVIEASYLGLFDFKKSVSLQADLLGLAFKTGQHFVVGLEHPAVLTLGYRADSEQEIFTGNALPIERIERGGLATIHSEGQLVIYPILNLRELNLGVRQYVCLLLKTTRQLLSELGIDCYIDDQSIGLFTAKGKIAFCGVQVKNGITQHGLSLNVRNDLNFFSQIRSCGITEPAFDRLCDYEINMTLPELYQKWVVIFRNQLNCNISESL